MSTPPLSMLYRPLGLALLATLAACGGGGIVPGTDTTALRTLPPDYFTRAAVAYEPFRTANRDTETVTSAEILQDLNLLVEGKFGLIRLYDS